MTKMSGNRIPVASTDLTAGECQVVLKALGEYQIRLFDKMKEKETGDIAGRALLKAESDQVSASIKKIHRLMEESKS